MLKKYVIKMGEYILLAFSLFLYTCLTYGFWWVAERATNGFFASAATFIFVVISMNLIFNYAVQEAAIKQIEYNRDELRMRQRGGNR